MKYLAVFAAATVGLATGCADNTTARARAPADYATPTTPPVEAPKPSTAASPTPSMSTSPGAYVVNNRDPPDRIPASR